MPEVGPFGDTFFEARLRAIVAASFLNKPSSGYVDSVSTPADHFRCAMRAAMRCIPSSSCRFRPRVVTLFVVVVSCRVLFVSRPPLVRICPFLLARVGIAPSSFFRCICVLKLFMLAHVCFNVLNSASYPSGNAGQFATVLWTYCTLSAADGAFLAQPPRPKTASLEPHHQSTGDPL